MRKFSLTQKLLLSTLVPILITFSILLLTTNYQVTHTLEPFVMASGLKQIQARAAQIAESINTYRLLLQRMSQSDELNKQYFEQKYQMWLLHEFEQLQSLGVENLFWVDLQGAPIFAVAGGASPFMQEAGFTDLATSKTKFYISNPSVSPISQRPIVTFAQSVFVEGQFKGIIGMQVMLNHLSEAVNKLSLGENSYGWLIDGSGLIVHHPNPKVAMQVHIQQADSHGFNGLQQHAKAILSHQSGHGTSHNARGWEVSIIWTPIRHSPNWVLSVAVPTKVLNHKINEVMQVLILIIGVSVLLIIGILVFSLKVYLAPLGQTVAMLQEIAAGEADLTQQLQVTTHDELGALSQYFNQFIGRIHEVVVQVVGVTQKLGTNAKQIHHASSQMNADMDTQQGEIAQIATAMNQLASTVGEVAEHAQNAFNAATTGRKEADTGKAQMHEVIRVMSAQSQVINQTAAQIHQLEESGKQIGDIMGVITTITEQINLLALNAAIEAARAGEAGRGFAVVADEVRNLAVKTHNSTNEIQQTVEDLLAKIAHAVQLMHATSTQAEQTAVQVQTTSDSLEAINRHIGSLEEVNTQIASASEQQKSTVDELNNKLNCIVDLSKSTATSTTLVEQEGMALDDSTHALQTLVARFKV